MTADPAAPPRGWRRAPGRGRATLGWWDDDTSSFTAFAVWTADHWEYETDEWSGRDPSPGDLPDGATDPRTSGWREASDGSWTRLVSPLPKSPPRARVSTGASLGMIVCFLAGLFGALVVLIFSVLKVQYWLTDDAGTVLSTPSGGGGVGALGFLFTGVPCLLGLLIAVTARRGDRRSSGLLTAALLLSILTVFSGCILVKGRSQVQVECFACTNPAAGGGKCVRQSGSDLTTHVVGESGVQCSTAALSEAESAMHLDQLMGALIALIGVVCAGIAAGLRWPTGPSARFLAVGQDDEPEDPPGAAGVGVATGVVLGTIAVAVIATSVAGSQVLSANDRAARQAAALPAIGRTQVGAAGESVTIHALDPDQSQPVTGQWTVAIDAEVCAGATHVSAEASSFRLTVPESGLSLDKLGQSGDQPPSFPASQDLAPGTCARGWVDFTVYAPSPPDHAVVQYGLTTELRWQWS